MFKHVSIQVRGVAAAALVALGLPLPAAAALNVVPAQTGADTRVSESGAADYYTLSLPEPPAPGEVVTITISPDAQLRTDGTRVEFTAANYAQPRTIRVTAVNDPAPEGQHAGEIRHDVLSSGALTGGRYAGATADRLIVTVHDNDQHDVAIAESGGATVVTEGGNDDEYTLVLSAQPAADVHISVIGDNERLGLSPKVRLEPSVLTFTPANYDRPQAVRVTAVDDEGAEGPHSERLRHTAQSADAAYNLFPIDDVVAQIVDNDAAGVAVAESGGATRVVEGGPGDGYTVVLTSRPSSNVVVAVTGGQDQLSTSPQSVTFTSANWNQPQPVAVAAVNDMANEGPHAATIQHQVTSSDAAYRGVPARPLTVTVTDDDSPGLSIGESGGWTQVREGGGADAYTLRLTQRPASAVTVRIIAQAPVRVSPEQVTFSAATFATLQTITVTVDDDLVVEATQAFAVEHELASADFAYDGLQADGVSVTVFDDDARGVRVTESGGATSVTEGGEPDGYTIALTARPDADVEVTVQSSAEGVSASPGSLLFTPENFATPQTVTVRAANDAVAQGPRQATLTHVAASADAGYAGIAVGAVTAAIADDDRAGVAVQESGGATQLVEGGAGDTYTIALLSQPLANVAVDIEADPQLTVDAATLTFTPDDWASPRTVRVLAADDARAQGARLASLAHAVRSADGAYDGAAAGAVTASITDDDTPGVAIAESDGATALDEHAGEDRYTLVLTSQPFDDVTVTVDAGDQLQASPASVTFTAADFDVPRTITVTAVDDTAVEGTHLATLVHAVASGDAAYDGVGARDVSVTITDDDVEPQAGTSSGGALPGSLLALFGALVLVRRPRASGRAG